MSSIEKAMSRMNKKARIQKPDQLQNSSSHPDVSRMENSNHSPGRNTTCQLNFPDLKHHGFLTPELARNKIADEYRAIKRPLLENAFGKNAQNIEFGNLIMVVSALPAEGKTFTSFNLAMSIAMEKDTTVLLVDSDIIKPSLTKMLGLQNLSGLTDVLLDKQLSLADVIVKTNMPKLNVVPAGSAHMHSTELLASTEMARVAVELSQRYPDRVVMFDAPPILVTTEAPVLARLAGQILVVVEAGRTEQQLVKEAVNLLDQTKVIGMVLNKSRGTSGGGYYGSGYGSYGAY